ncbi:MAG TPA: enoyl-CoA hydratase-related protein [Trebonia sp.]|nr:enoyl-CoA hydratase-related protein [Trebonia sp.]
MGVDQARGEEIVTVAVEGAVGIVTLRAPALTRAAKEQLLAGLRRLAEDEAVRAVLRVCAETAKFATAFTGIGLTFDSGLSATLTRAAGTARASELILLAEPFTAQQALDWGLVGRLADPGEVLAEARAIADRLAAGPTLAYAEAKRAIAAAARPALPDVLASEHAAQSRLGQTADHKAAVEAFLAKRRPEFHAR